MKKAVFWAAALVCALMALAGCKKPDKAESATVGSDSEAQVGAESESGDNGFELKKTLLSKGNNYRIKKVLEKIKRGEDVYVACIGGSITEGECGENEPYTNGYAYQFPALLQETFAKGKANIHSVVAGLSGTDSPVGLIRYKKDVVEKLGRSPDLLVMEFSIHDWNNLGDDFGDLRRGTFEQLIREVFEADGEAALIVLFTHPSMAHNMSQITKHYQVQEVEMTAAGDELKGVYAEDKKNLTVYGHSLVSQCLVYLLEEIDKDAEDAQIALPDDYICHGEYHLQLNGFKPLLFGDEKNNPDISAWNVGSFNKSDGATRKLKADGMAFPQNWTHVSGNESFSFTIDCKNLVIAYKDSGCGSAEVLVDGKNVSFNYFDLGYSDLSGNWSEEDHIEARIIFMEETSAKHKVEIKMMEGSEEKPFIICGFGYSK